jgi:hypothetical protein
MRTAVGHFADRVSADAAFDELVQRGFDRDDISILGRGREGASGLMDDRDHVTAGEGAAVGGIAGLLIGVAAMLIPGIGPIVAIGPLTAALTGAVTGGVTGAVVGGIAGALIDAGVPEDEARYYDERFRQGGILVTVRGDDMRYDEARTIMQRHGADVQGRGVAAGVGDDMGTTTGRESMDTPRSTTTRSTTVTSTDYPAPRAPDSNLADPTTRPMPPRDRGLT